VATPPPVSPFENPSSWLARFQLGRPVRSCESAAAAKGVPLEHELKSLLVDSDSGLVLAHVRANHRLSLRKVKTALSLVQARLADPGTLRSLNISPGTLNPFHRSLWQETHLVSNQVLSLPWVTTNAGEPDAYVVFDPLILLRAQQLSVSDLEE
jgi:prolyl-tRNA editing enzyme YbaK/EbsC (Cys-tRNA(Pro) deacylase)